MKRIHALESGRSTMVHVQGSYFRNAVSLRTHRHEQHSARVGVSCYTCGHRGDDYKPSYARTAMALIEDVHSIMDAWPVHAQWDVVY